jgi:hypothetical protein
MTRAATGLADLILAEHALRPKGGAKAALAQMLGMALLPEISSRTAPSPTARVADVDELDDAPPLPPTKAQAGALPPSVRHLEPVRQTVAPPGAGKDPLIGVRHSLLGKLAFEGLLTTRDGAELLRFAAAVPMASGDVDVDRVVRELSNARPLTELPRLNVPSLVFGAQVLVDVGRSMQPFFEDQEELLGQFVGGLRDRIEVLYFADDPALGAGPSRRRGTMRPHVPPHAGTPVIALTDLGCGYPRRPDASQAWLKLAQRLRRNQNRLVVFAPVRPARIPLELRREVTLVLWDRSAVRRNVMQLAGAPDE